ncbi:MAG: hypothetical protein K1X86_15575 [Ignavibacteria bacterium]|nr:hypothetical protein [Ignavibacteria bacterium]
MADILELPNEKKPSSIEELFTCTHCGTVKLSDEEGVTKVYLHEKHGLIIAPPEALCVKCVEERIKNYDNHLHPAA